MLPLQDWLEAWGAKAEDFLDGGDKELIYYRCVRAALADPATERLLGNRTGVTKDAVFERMRTVRYHRYATIRCPSPALDEAVQKLEEILEKYERADHEGDWNWQVVCSLIGLSAIALLIFGGLLALFVAGLATAAVLFTLFWRGSAAWFNLRQALTAAGLRISWLVQRFEVGVCAARWGEQLQKRGTGPVVADLVRHLRAPAAC